MDRVAFLGVMLALGACSSFGASEGPDTETETGSGTGEETGTPSGNDSAATNPTSGAGSDSDSGTTTNPTTDPSTTGTLTTDPTESDTSTGGGETVGNESSGSESTNSESTGSDSADDTSTGAPPQSCGDGLLGDGEDCDDSNADELDGCTSACEFGPTGLDYGSTIGTGLDGGNGTVGTSDNTEECPANHVLVGLQGDLTLAPWVGVIGGICRPAALTNTNPPEFATGGPATPLPEHGGFDGGGAWSTECGSDQAIVAVQGGSGAVIDGLQILCADVDTVGDAGAYDLEPTPEDDFESLQGGSTGGSFGPLACPAGRVAVGLRTLTNSYVIQIELLCRELDLTY